MILKSVRDTVSVYPTWHYMYIFSGGVMLVYKFHVMIAKTTNYFENNYSEYVQVMNSLNYFWSHLYLSKITIKHKLLTFMVSSPLPFCVTGILCVKERWSLITKNCKNIFNFDSSNRKWPNHSLLITYLHFTNIYENIRESFHYLFLRLLLLYKY